MAIKWIGQKWCPEDKDYSKEFICDTDVDVANLPECPSGSTALVAASGKIHIVNASGVWVEFGAGV